MDNSIVPAHLAVKAMRDNGYKNAAYAIAELIDNSIQNGSTKVQLLCAEIEVSVNVRTVSRINKIGVLDNGSGMDEKVLLKALQFGNGTHLEESSQDGIGKFGMGLPSSSISQAKRVEVWSWQNGIENALYTFLDIDDIVSREMSQIPKPEKREIPPIWRAAGSIYENSGTLVVWSNIDRCIWKSASSIISNSELVIGRMYRYYLVEKRAEIEMVSFMESTPNKINSRKWALPNDPLYLMEKTSCPAPFSEKPMFEPWGGGDGIKYSVTHNGRKHEITLRFSIATKGARQGYNTGDRPYGKHAKSNIGVSIVRAGRELDLDQGWTIRYDSRERWWGAEIHFPPSLDEIFGVTNNKQHAHNFSEMASDDFLEAQDQNKTIIQLRKEMLEEGDPKGLLLEIVEKIRQQIKSMRVVIQQQGKGKSHSKDKRHGVDDNSPEKKATEATSERVEDGHIGTSDGQEKEDIELRKKDVEISLVDEGVDNAPELVNMLFSNNIKYTFVDSDFESSAFFGVKSRGGKIIISLNIKHPAYSKLVEVLDSPTQGVENEELEDRLRNASEGLKLLFMAWARYEDELPDGKMKNGAQDARQDWGRIAREFLTEE